MEDERVYIFSYPRSGNTWVRYFLEFLSKKPTKGYDNKIDGCPTMKANVGVDFSKQPIAYKSHKIYNLKENEKMICIVRDYKETLPRHAKAGGHNTPRKMKAHFIQQTEGRSNADVDYMDVIETYDISPVNRKLLVYYEDLLTYPRSEIKRIIDFLNINDKYLSDFMKDYERHKNNSIKAYAPGSYTKGSNFKFHSSTLNPKYLDFMTNHLKEKHTELFNKYLKRYE